jgi:hypothetical protein
MQKDILKIKETLAGLVSQIHNITTKIMFKELNQRKLIPLGLGSNSSIINA